MEKSAFQFSTPILNRLNFSINEDFQPNQESEIPIGVEIRSERTSPTEAIVSLTVSIGSPDTSAPFFVEVEESAHFRWQAGAFTEDEEASLLKQNAPSLLISYVRPIVANVTGASLYRSFDLPFLNLTK